MLLSVDPGVKEAGVAVFESSELTTAWLARGKNWIETADRVHDDFPGPVNLVQTVVIERPQIYVQSRQKGDANDLITLALFCGRVTGLFSGWTDQVVEYRPHEWKKQVPKNIMMDRIIRRLSDEEFDRIQLPKAKSLYHNIFDAIGIGLHHLQRR